MKKLSASALLCLVSFFASAQFIYKIKADSLLVTNDSCNAELNLENSTRHVNGFLYNKGNGRTEFRRALFQINDSMWVSGNDTLNLGSSGLFWKLKGNAGTNPATDFLGTIDSNKLAFKTYNQQRASILANGIVNIGWNDTASRPPFRFYPNGDFVSNATRNYNDSASLYKNGIRYHSRLGYLEIGTSNFIDTTVTNGIEIYQTSALILNTDSPNHLKGKVQNSILAAYNVNLDSAQLIRYSLFSGGSFFMTKSVGHTIAGGNFHTITGNINCDLVVGNSQWILNNDQNSFWTGFNNRTAASTTCNITGGIKNTIGSVAQLTNGAYLTNRSYAASMLGNANVDFTSLPYNDVDSILVHNTQNIESRALLFALGNSNSKTAATRSNALSILYNGRTQINTTGFSNNLSESDVTPKAALEIVSNNSGVLLPKLTTTQRDAITGGDLQNGLVLYNTDDNRFQFYNGSVWKTLCDSCSSGGGSGWSLIGNAGTNPGTNFVGTTDSNALVFRTFNTEKARITPSGAFQLGNAVRFFPEANNIARITTINAIDTGADLRLRTLRFVDNAAPWQTAQGTIYAQQGDYLTLDVPHLELKTPIISSSIQHTTWVIGAQAPLVFSGSGNSDDPDFINLYSIDPVKIGNNVGISFSLNKQAATKTTVARVSGLMTDTTTASPDGQLEFSTLSNSTLAKRLVIDSVNFVAGADSVLAMASGTKRLVKTKVVPSIDSTLKLQGGNLGVKVDTVLSYFARNYRSNYADFTDEFWDGTDLLNADWSGTSSNVTSITTTENNHPGLLQLVTGTQSNGRAGVLSFSWPAYMGSGQYFFETEVFIPTLSTSGQRFQLVCGLYNSQTAATQSDGIFFLYDEGGVSTGSTAASYWQTCTGSGSTRTYNTSLTQVTVPAAGWTKLRIYADYSVNQVYFFINGTLVSTHTANMPSSVALTPGVAMWKSAGTTSRTANLDYVSYQKHFSTSR